MKSSIKFRIEKQEQGWSVVDPDNANAGLIFDQMVVDATYVSRDQRVVEGFIVAAQGLDMQVAQDVPRQFLNALGIGANLRSMPPAPRRGSGVFRFQLEQDGRLTPA